MGCDERPGSSWVVVLEEKITDESEYKLTRNYDLENSRSVFLIKSVCVLTHVYKLVFFYIAVPKIIQEQITKWKGKYV